MLELCLQQAKTCDFDKWNREVFSDNDVGTLNCWNTLNSHTKFDATRFFCNWGKNRTIISLFNDKTRSKSNDNGKPHSFLHLSFSHITFVLQCTVKYSKTSEQLQNKVLMSEVDLNKLQKVNISGWSLHCKQCSVNFQNMSENHSVKKAEIFGQRSL